MRMGVQRHALATLPPGKTRHPLYRRLGVPQGRYGRVRKFSPTSGFDPRTVQPVASRYTNWAIPATQHRCENLHSAVNTTEAVYRRYLPWLPA
jgi:hypothetical protein